MLEHYYNGLVIQGAGGYTGTGLEKRLTTGNTSDHGKENAADAVHHQ